MAIISLFSLSLLFLLPFATNCTLQNLYYTQQLNHFGVGGPLENSTFQQRYVIDNTFWAGAEKRGPLLVYFGGEAPINNLIGQVGVINEAAPRLGALVVYIEHRFYGESIPYKSIDTAFLSPAVRSFLSTEEALADFVEIILSVKTSLSTTSSPVIVIGGSYAGMLAAWFRLKYPQVAVGALASSAPVLFFEDLSPEDDYCAILTRDFEQVNRHCSDMIRQSWNMIDEVALRPGGLDMLTKTFNICRTLHSTNELKVHLINMYTFATQYNGAHNYWIDTICSPIVNASKYNIVLDGIAIALLITERDSTCVRLSSTGAPAFHVLDPNSLKAWNWQECSEIVNIRSCNGYNSIIPREFFPNKTKYMQDCWDTYGVWPHADWVRTYYGAWDIKYGSNIIFSNGLMDPYSRWGVLDDISDTVVAIKTEHGSHCLDLNPSFHNDPKWLKNQRRKEIKIFENWISEGRQLRVRTLSLIWLLMALVLGL